FSVSAYFTFSFGHTVPVCTDHPVSTHKRHIKAPHCTPPRMQSGNFRHRLGSIAATGKVSTEKG
ncbi:hypothetical protein, partial [Klebsiella pneumoniae]|uniref:hypothetical protein n=1 Tax=Klebsiella pneumoniae TaxID=573 RepID=UPI001CD9DF39